MDEAFYFDAHFHLLDNKFGDKLAKAINEENTMSYYIDKYYDNGDNIGGIIMGNGPLGKQGLNLSENFYYLLGLDDLSYYPLEDKQYNKIKEHIKKNKCLGVKLYPGYVPYYPDEEIFKPIFEMLLEHNKVLAVHSGALSRSGTSEKYANPRYIGNIAEQYNDLKIVMCHFGNPYLEDAAAVMDNNLNVYADLSGLAEGNINADNFASEQAEFVEHFRNYVYSSGKADRFLFGSDWPAVNCSEYKKFIAMLFDEKDLTSVMLDNALKVYGLKALL